MPVRAHAMQDVEKYVIMRCANSILTGMLSGVNGRVPKVFRECAAARVICMDDVALDPINSKDGGDLEATVQASQRWVVPGIMEQETALPSKNV